MTYICVSLSLVLICILEYVIALISVPCGCFFNEKRSPQLIQYKLHFERWHNLQFGANTPFIILLMKQGNGE